MKERGVSMSRRLVIVAAILGLVITIPAAALAHGHSDTMHFVNDCSVDWRHAHNSTAIEADTDDAFEIAHCEGYHAEIHYKLDGFFYSEHSWDTVKPWTGAHADQQGWDVFYWSDHDANPIGAPGWVGARKYH